MVLPLFSGRFANWMAAHTAAPEEMSTSTPSFLPISLPVANACVPPERFFYLHNRLPMTATSKTSMESHNITNLSCRLVWTIEPLHPFVNSLCEIFH